MLLVVSLALAVAAPGDKPGGKGAKKPAPDLAAPVRVEAAGKPIDTAVGHAAPFVGDFDGDGKADLLVGQFGGGLLWVYPNEATAGTPRLAEGFKFKGGTPGGTVPAG